MLTALPKVKQPESGAPPIAKPAFSTTTITPPLQKEQMLLEKAPGFLVSLERPAALGSHFLSSWACSLPSASLPVGIAPSQLCSTS